MTQTSWQSIFGFAASASQSLQVRSIAMLDRLQSSASGQWLLRSIALERAGLPRILIQPCIGEAYLDGTRLTLPEDVSFNVRIAGTNRFRRAFLKKYWFMNLLILPSIQLNHWPEQISRYWVHAHQKSKI